MIDALASRASPRAIAATVLLACIALMAIALYMEHVMLLAPCPLCMMQRVWVYVAGGIALVALLHGRALGRYAMFTSLACVIGGGFSLRQLYLQSLPPDQVPACGPDLYYMLDAFPFADVLKAMVLGTGNCAAIDWSLFGISIAGYMLIGFIALLLLCFLQYRLAERDRA